MQWHKGELFHRSGTDADDVEGETDQDWCKGRTPCSAGDLLDGRSGDSGADWTAAVAHTSTGLICAVRILYGLIVPARDPQVSPPAYLELLRDPMCRKAMSKAFRECVVEHFTSLPWLRNTGNSTTN